MTVDDLRVGAVIPARDEQDNIAPVVRDLRALETPRRNSLDRRHRRLRQRVDGCHR